MILFVGGSRCPSIGQRWKEVTYPLFESPDFSFGHYPFDTQTLLVAYQPRGKKEQERLLWSRDASLFLLYINLDFGLVYNLTSFFLPSILLRVLQLYTLPA